MTIEMLIKAMLQNWTRTPKPCERYPVHIASNKPILPK